MKLTDNQELYLILVLAIIIFGLYGLSAYYLINN